MTEKITREQIEAVKATGARWVNEETFAVICDLALRATEQPARPSEEAVANRVSPDDDSWRSVALCIGEHLCATGPRGYYEFTPREWYKWSYRELVRRLDALAKGE